VRREWVVKYDPVKHRNYPNPKCAHGNIFFGYNVWGFRDESWRKLIIPADPNQPCARGYRGSTPSFVIHQLVHMFKPKRVLDSMAGLGTTGWVCKQYGIECDQFDLYSFPKLGVKRGDAEHIETGKTYDLIFNHIPYLGMVKYGDLEEDLSKHGGSGGSSTSWGGYSSTTSSF
jgi:hypothetical protein